MQLCVRIDRHLVTLASLLVCLALTMPAAAQQCQPLLSGKRFTLIVPYSPGGGFDGYARIFASRFEVMTGSDMRIRNLPGAGTMIGINAIVEAGPADLVLGLINPTTLLNDLIIGRDSQAISSMIYLGSLNTDPTAWVTRRNNQVIMEGNQPRLFAMASNSDFIRILLPGYVLDWNINLIRGYNGSNEAMLALLRGDVDYFYTSSVSLAAQNRSSNDLVAFISLTDAPDPLFPGADYLAGAGGLVERLSSGLDGEQQRQQLELASLVAELANTYRAIGISSTADPALVDCLAPVVEGAIFSDELRAAAERQYLVVAPIGGATLQQELERSEALIESNWELLQELVARSR